MIQQITTLIASTLAGNHLLRAALDVHPGHHLVDDLGADPLDLVCICVAVEEAFGFEIGDDELAAWERVADVIASVEGREAA